MKKATGVYEFYFFCFITPFDIEVNRIKRALLIKNKSGKHSNYPVFGQKGVGVVPSRNMSNNPIAECKKIEEQGKELIREAKKEAEAMVEEARRQGRKDWDRAEEEARPEVESVWKKAEEEISALKKQGEKDKQARIRELEKVDEKRMEEAVNLVVERIFKD